ncbi:hypothetical protein EJ03DRAFT_4065 [Teratosphaeria nubilosa]|uniref:Uncharacterized protein n=1 Tax=Teratosphaeria nubilosa TaxID=161662 RepID=A0A6G1LNR9_9PEZI|nr:hypothetical protein EJ03DRAFT_4065 [Teratosphaeria nubilosa]
MVGTEVLQQYLLILPSTCPRAYCIQVWFQAPRSSPAKRQPSWFLATELLVVAAAIIVNATLTTSGISKASSMRR